jgi:putative phage-type endonuclease
MPKLIELDQGAADWLQWRLGGLGGSDANLLAAYFLGLDFPYGDTWPGAALYKLWAEKTKRNPLKPSKDRSWGDYKDPLVHGKEMEVEARRWWCEETLEMGAPACLEDEARPHMRTSLDLYVEGVVAAEVKCPKEPKDHRAAKEGQIPRKYLGQLHHNYAVAACPEFHFVSYYEGEGVIVPFVPDPQFMGDLLEAEGTFWRWVIEQKFPLAAGEVSGAENPDWIAALEGYWKQQQLVREAEEGLRYCKLNLFKQMQKMGGRKITGGNATVTYSVLPRKVMAPRAGYERAEYLDFRIQHAGDEDGD